jgi:sugar lactone lactonase YvrE
MKAAGLASLMVVAALVGCQGASGPIFPEVDPPITWPPPPDTPRIRYVGVLTGEASLGARPQGWEAVQAVLVGPRPTVAFSRPTAVAVDGSVVYVADIGLGVVHRLDLDARAYAALRGDPADQLRVPIDVCIGPNGVVYVVDRERAAIEVFAADGAWRRTVRVDEIAAPVACAWDDVAQRLWIADIAAHALFAIDAQGALVETRGQRGGGPAEFNFPRALALRADGALIVADAMNFRVQVLERDGRLLTAFGQQGDAAGDFAGLRDVAVDSDAHIYALDNQFENVQVFDAAGRLLMAFGGEGAAVGQFALPSGITIDAGDRIWIADSLNRRVQVFQYLTESES